MSKFLKQNLPSQFKKDKYQKGAYCISNENICCSVLLKKIKYYDPIDINDKGAIKYKFEIMVSVQDKYSELFEENISTIVVLSSLEENSIEPINNSFDASNWDLDDEEGLLNALNNHVIPWLEKFSNSQVIIDYLIALENVALGKKNKNEISKFGKLITGDLIFPIRVMKSYNGIIATLYECQGNYKRALIHLKKHKEFVTNDHSPSCIVKTMNDVFNKRLFLINDGLKKCKTIINN